MNIELKQKYLSDFSQLRKIVNSWNFIPDTPSDEFDSLTNKILSHLYKDFDFDKITKVLSNELTEYYGLFLSESDSQKLTKDIFEWWEKQ
jgi:hypothetical protein